MDIAQNADFATEESVKINCYQFERVGVPLNTRTECLRLPVGRKDHRGDEAPAIVYGNGSAKADTEVMGFAERLLCSFIVLGEAGIPVKRVWCNF